MFRVGIILLIFGIIYLIKPDIYKRGIWTKTAITQQVFSPVRYKQYMRLLGIAFIVSGLVLLILSRR